MRPFRGLWPNTPWDASAYTPVSLLGGLAGAWTALTVAAFLGVWIAFGCLCAFALGVIVGCALWGRR